jgi:hypothetical protein
MRTTRLLALLACVILPAVSAAKEEQLYLPGTGLDVKLECATCTVDRSDLRKDRLGRWLGTDDVELIDGDRSVKLQLLLTAREAGDGSLCDDPVARLEKVQGVWGPRPAWAPKTFKNDVVEEVEGGRYRAALCADVPGGSLLVVVQPRGAGAVPSPELQKRMGDALDRLVKAARPSVLDLKKAKLSVELPLIAGAWRRDGGQGDVFRLGKRRTLRFEPAGAPTCEAAIEADTRARPAFVPGSWHARVGAHGLDGSSGRWVTCLEAPKPFVAEVEGPMTGGNAEERRLTMVFEAVSRKAFATTAEPGVLPLATAGLVLRCPLDRARPWERGGEARLLSGAGDDLRLVSNPEVHAAVAFSVAPCASPGEGWADAADHMEWLQWKRGRDTYYCADLYRGSVAVQVTQPATTVDELDESRYELMRNLLLAAQRKAGYVPSSGLSTSLLPALGITAELRPGFFVRAGGPGEDIIDRGPRGNGLRVTLARRAGACADALAKLNLPDAADVSYPPLAGWHPRRLQDGASKAVTACLDLAAGAHVLARFEAGRDAPAAWKQVAPMLEGLAPKRVGDAR